MTVYDTVTSTKLVQTDITVTAQPAQVTYCGSRGSPPCPPGETCSMFPTDRVSLDVCPPGAASTDCFFRSKMQEGCASLLLDREHDGGIVVEGSGR